MNQGHGKVIQTAANIEPVKKPESVVISMDMKNEEIISYDQAGATLVFMPEAMRVLPEEIVKGLKFENQRNYFINYALSKDFKAHDPDEVKIEIIETLGDQAMNRLKVRGKQKGRHYCWKRPDEVDEAKRVGYSEVSEKDPEKTPGATTVGTRKIEVADGKTDLVLLSIDEGRYQGHLAATAQLSRERTRTAETDFKDRVKEINKKVKVINFEERE